MNPYDELGVAPDADIDAINAAYRAKARATHPDAGGDADEFERLATAVAVLRDPERRARFDQTGQTATPDTAGLGTELFLQAIQRALSELRDPQHADVIAGAKQLINAALGGLRAERNNGLTEQLRTIDLLSRAERKSDGPNLVAGMFRQRLDVIGKQLAQLDQHEAELLAALSLADDYEWHRDPAPQAHATATNTTWIML